MSELSESKIHAECNRQIAELEQRLAWCQRLQQDMNTIYTVANLTKERDELRAKLAVAESVGAPEETRTAWPSSRLRPNGTCGTSCCGGGDSCG